MRWSVSLIAEGDRAVTHEEILALADAVALHQGIASGLGTSSYGVQVVVDAADRDGALAQGSQVLRAAATAVGLPAWEIARAEAVSEAEEEAAEAAGEEATDYVDFSRGRR